MPTLSPIKIQPLDKPDTSAFTRACVGCLILSQDGKLVLQQRDLDCQRFPGCLGTFGGGIEPGETPMQALVRELKEELGADVKMKDVISLGALAETISNERELVHVFFWHDKHGTITGCYEGTAKYYNHPGEAKTHPLIMNDVRWLLQECQIKNLI